MLKSLKSLMDDCVFQDMESVLFGIHLRLILFKSNMSLLRGGRGQVICN